MHRAALLATILSMSAAWAGCVSDDGETGPARTDACAAGVCPAGPGAWPEWTLPEGAEALLTFAEGYGPLVGVTRLGDGWAWAVRGADHLRLEHWADGTLLRQDLPAGRTMRTGGLEAHDGAVWLAHYDEAFQGDGALVRWHPGEGDLTSWPLPEATGPIGVTGVGAGDRVVLVGSGAWPDDLHRAALWTRGAVAALGPPDARTGAADVLGKTVIYTHAVPNEETHGASAVVIEDAVTGSTHTVATNATVRGGVFGVFADGGFAFTTGEDAGPHDIWRVDRTTHQVTFVGEGDQPAFTDRGMFYVAQEPGLSPDVRFRSDVTGTEGSVFFLRPRTVWNVDEQGAAWVEPPSADPRFLEAANPTPFDAALYTRG